MSATKEAKPTPGPWHVVIESGPGTETRPPRSVFIASAYGVIARCGMLPEVDVNARLIAAVPELRDRLEQLYQEVSRHVEDWQMGDFLRDSLAQAREVLDRLHGSDAWRSE